MSGNSSQEILAKRDSYWPEILKRVPTTQLGVCLCVSKKWYNLITSSSFISSHNNATFKQSSNLFMLRSFCKPHPFKDPREFYRICYDNDVKTLETLETLTKKTVLCPFKTTSELVHFRFVGSVNGVVLLSDDVIINNNDFILWNPLVSCFIRLPKPRANFDAVGRYIHAFGVGYDGEMDDFKVVRIVYPARSDGLDETPPRVEVYSVKEGEWRWVPADNVEYCIIDKAWSQCFLKGSVHWLAYEREKVELGSRHKSNVLLLFNVERENFLMMKLPQELRDVSPFSLTVSERQGMLCVNHHVTTKVYGGEPVHYNLWVKKEYNKVKSWCKVISMDLQSSIVDKAIYWRKNAELLAWKMGCELVSYDPETGNVAELAPDIPGLYDGSSFVESLAFLNKDCKNRRCFLSMEDDNHRSIYKTIRGRTQCIEFGRSVAYMNQLRKFRRQF